MNLSLQLLFVALFLPFLQEYRAFVAAQNLTFGTVCSSVDANGPIVSGSLSWRVFNQLTHNETEQILDFLIDVMGYYDVRQGSTSKTKPTTSGPNIIYRIELMEPVKDEAINYLDFQGPQPERYAFAVVIRSENEPKDVMEYKIGPLPLSLGSRKIASEIGKDGDDSPVEGVIMQKLRENGEIPYSKRPAEPISVVWSERIISREAYKIRKIFKEATGWCYGIIETNRQTRKTSRKECGKDNIIWISFPALDTNTTRRVMHITWFFRTLRGGGNEMNLHSIPISFKLEEADTNEENWDTFDFEYCHQGPYSSAEELLGAYNNGELVKCIAEDWKDYNYDESWSRTNNQNRFRTGSEQAGPRTFYPDGPRFSIQEAERGTGFWLNYLGWEGHVSMRYGTGIVFHDIRFRGNRIVYELALQEQYVAYGGYAGGGQAVYLDSYFAIGLSSQPLKRGSDCPETARYFPMSKFYVTGAFQMAEEVICVFEEDAQTPEWRHTHFNGSDGRPHIDSERRSSLVVRTVATVGNYDYLYSIRFKPDASIEVETTLAGYMLTTFYDINGQTAREGVFGTRVHKHTLANLHDHLSGWKVDLDILGRENSVREMSIRVGTWEDALKSAMEEGTPPPPWHSSPVVKYFHTEQLNSEFGFLIRDPGAVIHSFTNEKFTNSWGQPRGYAIVHGMTTRQLLPDTHPFTKAASWTKYHLAVTQRKENELLGHSAIYDMVSPGDPITSLDNYINGENIGENDLVAWVMMGLLHLPRSEDVPLISNFASRFYIKPWNYYDELVSMDWGTKEDFASCIPRVGNDYEYRWAADP